jgi:glycosidase
VDRVLVETEVSPPARGCGLKLMEFHISRNARERYQFRETLFSFAGNVVFADMGACREFAHRMNQVREAKRYPERAVHAGQLYAMGLIDEASHVVMARYRQQFDPEVMSRALDWFQAQVGERELDKLLLTFVEHFPGQRVLRGEQTAAQWLADASEGTPHREAALEELLLLWTANRNEAFRPFAELFEDKALAEKTVYRQVTGQLPEYFATRPLVPLEGAQAVSLIELLRAPAVDSPASLSEQLRLILRLWKPLLGKQLERFLEVAGEILHEEELAIWAMFNPPDEEAQARALRAAETLAAARRAHGNQQWPEMTAHAEVPVYDSSNPATAYEKFSPDTAWMPTAVLIAKSTYVWLAQLSKQFGRHIHRLDQIPDEELATLVSRGLNSLWLIGVWERSRASKTIKQLCGNQDAVASAYSLFDYRIAEDLGGEGAYVNLRDRCYRHGLRLASDMVPNHMGIDSPWVVEHPEWFISRNESPYPAYSFEGPDLSSDGRVEIKIDDHYYEQSDAAVVFRRRDRSSGETRYIYHGNDGTSFPWNDTAQLDYLNPAVREQVIQAILYVARLFPVIRFDAAMTLAKMHVQRLWFPAPGDSGAIPSRAEYSMSRAEFNQHMPHEFWREVVDRVAAEVPGTLLLAEAFWMLEGYFVRTLGMHRVYNSAFMVMLRDEDNAKYRSVIKTTLEFDPDIMKRYVNFMSNPDERTAVDQFGTGDKCFGVAALMATLPGLPMFGHGQIEGFTEKYGMEYYRPRYDESPNQWLVDRHNREIAPLLQRRWLFAESANFLLYDFFQDSGVVDEHVFAYSNRSGDEPALVVYNNRYGATEGTIDFSAAYADKGQGQLRQQRLAEGLGVTGDREVILAFRDSLTGLEYLRHAGRVAEQGLRLGLHAYQCHVFLDWRQLRSSSRKPWDTLCDQLNDGGVPSLEDALVGLELRPVHDALRLELDPSVVRMLADLAEHPRLVSELADKKVETRARRQLADERQQFFELAWHRCQIFLRTAQQVYILRIADNGQSRATEFASPALLAPLFRQRLQAAMRIPMIEAAFRHPWTAAARRVLPSPSPQFTATAMWGPLLAWCALELLAESIDAEAPEKLALDLFDRLRLREPLGQAFGALGFDGEEGWRVAARIKVVLLSEAGIGRQEAGGEEAAPVDSNPVDSDQTGPDPNAEERAQDRKAVARFDAESPAAGAEPEAVVRESVALAPALWLDPDVRWLTGVHEAKGQAYLVRERYEELLWWLLMPRLLRLAGEPVLDRREIERVGQLVDEAMASVEQAGYRIATLLGEAPDQVSAEDAQQQSSWADTPEAVHVEPAASARTESIESEEVSPVVEAEK